MKPILNFASLAMVLCLCCSIVSAQPNSKTESLAPITTYLLLDDSKERVKGPRPKPLPEDGTLRRRTDGLDFEMCRYKTGDGGMRRKNMPSRPQVIKFGWDNPYIEFLMGSQQELDRDFIEQLNSPLRAFDGIGWTLRHATTGSMTKNRLSASDMERRMKFYDKAQNGTSRNPNVKFNRVRHDMMRLLSNHVAGGFKKDNYDEMLDNLRNMARAVSKRPAMEGILLDTEWYPGVSSTDPWNYSKSTCEGYTSDTKGNPNAFTSPAKREECNVHAFNRGYDAMDVILQEWPDVKVLTLFGIWTEDPRTFNYITGRRNNPNTGFAPHYAWHNSQGVAPHFLAGMFAATICTDATFIDGTELYGLYEKSDFVKAGNFITNLLVDDSPYLPTNIREAYRDAVGLGFGVYDFRTLVFRNHEKFPMTSFDHNDWETVIKNASDTATHYVWLFTEIHDWWSKDINDWPNRPDNNSLHNPVERQRQWEDATKRAIDYIKRK